MNRRGITLTEVLVAIFVTGLGLIALMTLFPLGALNMAQAIKDDRTAQAAANANANLRMWWRSQLWSASTGHNPSQTNPPQTNAPDVWAPPMGPGYPVYLDPVGNAITG